MDVLARRVAATPGRPALVDAGDGRTWCYRELDGLVSRAVDRLRERAPGTDRVGTLFAPSPAFVVTFHAAQRLGWTVVGLDRRLPASKLRARAAQAAVDCIVYGPEVDPPGDLATPVVAGGDLVDNSNRVTDDTADAADRSTAEHGPVGRSSDPDTTAVVLFTSATTGDPKGVRLTAENLRASAVASAFRLGVSPGERWLCCLPVDHMGGLAPVVRTALYGTTLVVQREFDAEATGRVVAERAVTGVSLVPVQLRRLLDAGAPLPELSTVLVGGAPTPDALLERALDAGVPVSPTYGTTETASQIATARPTVARGHPGTVGQPLYGVDVTVVADGEPADTGEHGEIVVDGPTVTPGYLDPARTEAAFCDWGLRTGDAGYRDTDGRLWVVGRRDELVNTGGELVAPQAVVERLCSHPRIEDAAVVGLDDPEWGDRVAALVVPDGGLDAATVHEHSAATLAGYERPKTVLLAADIPRTVSGTVDREAVRERLRERG